MLLLLLSPLFAFATDKPSATRLTCAETALVAPLPPGLDSLPGVLRLQQDLQGHTRDLIAQFGFEAGVYRTRFPQNLTAPDRNELSKLGLYEAYIVTGGEAIALALKNPALFEREYMESPAREQAHQALAPFLNKRYVTETFLPLVQSEARITLSRWQQTPEHITVNRGLERFAMGNVFGPLFGQPLPEVPPEVSQAMARLFLAAPLEQHETDRRMFEALVAPALAYAKEKPNGTRLIHGLLQAQTKLGKPDAWVYDQMITTYFAGQFTTKVMLGIAMYYLAAHPEYQARLRAEYAEFKRTEDVESLLLTEAVLKEALRLFPPVPTISRFTTKNVQLGPYVIPAYSYVNLNLAAGFRRAEIWGDSPDEFKPERFLNRAVSRYDFCPFGFGPRICIGQHLAMLEGKMFLGVLLSQVEVRLKRPFELPVEQLGFGIMSLPELHVELKPIQ